VTNICHYESKLRYLEYPHHALACGLMGRGRDGVSYSSNPKVIQLGTTASTELSILRAVVTACLAFHIKLNSTFIHRPMGTR